MEQVKKIKAFFGRTGGKHFSKKSILPFIKDLEYDTYVEPFIGAGSIFLGREKKANREIINDYDQLVVNLWKGMKSSGNELKDYSLYFQDKSVFKWWLLKEKQDRRLRHLKGKYKGNKKYLKEIYGDNDNIETFKEDIFIHKKSNLGRRSPWKKIVNKNECFCVNNPNNENKIETFKEELYIEKLERFGHKGGGRRKLPNKVANTICGCVRPERESNSSASHQHIKIETLKEDLYITKLSRSQDNTNPLNNCNTCPDIKHKRNDIKIETLKEDLFICNKSFSQNNTTPNKKVLEKGKSIYTTKHWREEHKEETIDNEEKEDPELCCSIEKTEEGLKLIKKKYYVRNNKYKGDETKWRLHNPNLCGWTTLLKQGHLYHERLQNVEINQGDYREMLKYDSPKTLFYFDPPWTKTATGSKGNSCYSGWVELEDFYNSIKDLKGKWLCSYNNDEDILKRFEDHRIEYINTVYTQKKAGSKKTVDILIFSKNFFD